MGLPLRRFMRKILSTLLFSLILTGTQVVIAQPVVPSISEMATAIHRIKTGERGNLRWHECGQRLSPAESLSRATEYAGYFLTEASNNSDFNPWVGAAIVMQESSFNRCAISHDARSLFVDRIREEYDRDPSEADLARLLRSRTWRARMGVASAFDAGLAQFRWPGVMATRAGMEDPASLMDARTSIHMLAVSMQRYRTACESIIEYRGVHTVNRRDGTIRVVRYSIPCEEGYWVQHNSPSRFNYRYYHNVMRRYRELLRLSERPVPLEEDDES